MSLDKRMVELISIGVSVGVNCQPCLQYHVTKAREIGISDEDIQGAVNAGRMVKNGASFKMEQHIARVCGEEVVEQNSGEKGCGCGCC